MKEKPTNKNQHDNDTTTSLLPDETTTSNRHESLRQRAGRYQRPSAPTPAEEAVFLTMRQRQLQRDLNGARKKTSSLHMVALLSFLASLFGVGVSSYNEGTLTTTLQIQFWQLLLTGFWFLVCSFTLSTFAESTYFETLVWMMVYWPLMATAAALLVVGSTELFDRPTLIFIGFLTAESSTLVVAILVHSLYPRWLRSNWFLRHHWTQRYWSLHAWTNFTLTYTSRRRRHTCMYAGDICEQTLLPHGWGEWRDDAGEQCAGWFQQGVPVAPLRSRTPHAALRAVRVAYVLATDDTPTRNQFVPSNNLTTCRSGVASVECSVQGAFYKHLPAVSLLHEPGDVDMEECWKQTALTEQQQGATPHSQQVSICVDGRQCVQVSGHVFAPTGLPYTDATEEVVVRMEREVESQAGLKDYEPDGPPQLSMPYSAFSSSMDEVIFIPQDSSESGDVMVEEEALTNHDRLGMMDSLTSLLDRAAPKLKIDNWIAAPQKDALIYLSGFNSTLEKSLKNVGQFLAMTQVTDHVIPIVFAWPGGNALTYQCAADISASQKNMDLFLEFMKSLKESGIRHVHFMTHSMGVQTLLHALHDTIDGERSAVSKLFRLHRDFGPEQDEETSGPGEDVMLCKNIILVNPDFPVRAFVNHTYLSLRRICGTITVIGDQSDQALFMSQLFNGLFKVFGWKQPSILNENGKVLTQEELHQQRRQLPRYQRVIGRDFRMLHIRRQRNRCDGGDVECNVKQTVDKRLLFKRDRMKTPMLIVGAQEATAVQERQWLDIDVIDTTNLDANIMGLRHSGFNLNPTMLKDLEELIVTGRRAADRSALLFREGNTYSYCHAPAFVSM